MKAHWNLSQISDEVYKTKFSSLPSIISDWTGEFGGLAGKDILDFGCGEATTALGIALQHNPKRVVGVEIQDEYQRCTGLAKEQIGLDALPENLDLIRVTPGELHNTTDRFDVIYSWSVFEHIPHPMIPGILKMLLGALKPHGVLFIQVAPLYYSAEGSHMTAWVKEPWCHLLHQHDIFYEKLEQHTKDREEAKSLWNTYRTLNRVTAQQLASFVTAAGFETLRDYRTQDEYAVPAELLSIYTKEVLVTNQIVLLLRNQNQY